MYPQNWRLVKGSLSTQSIKILTGSTVDKRFFGRPKWAFLGIGTTKIWSAPPIKPWPPRGFFSFLGDQKGIMTVSALVTYCILGFWIQIHTHRTNVWYIYLHLPSKYIKSANCGYITHTWIRHGILFSSIQPVVIKTHQLHSMNFQTGSAVFCTHRIVRVIGGWIPKNPDNFLRVE